MAKFKLTDITAATWRTVSNPPDGTATPPEPSSLCLQDVTTCQKNTADRVNDKPHYARNTDWTPGLLPSVTNPMSWPFLQQPLITQSKVATYGILNLAFVAAPSAGYSVKIYSVTFTGNATAPPHVIAVAFPTNLNTSARPPFLVHYKHVPGQNPSASWFKYFDPKGYDWLAFEIWRWLNYTAEVPASGPVLVDMPFLSAVQDSFGFCYQLRQANKQYVIVLPQISRIFDTNGKLRDYQLYSASMLRKILIAIQKDILSISDDTLSHVALSGNSSGCNLIGTFLTENIAAAKTDKVIAEFMKDELNEVFVLDPPESSNESMVTSLGGWLKAASSRSGAKGKCVRFYTHTFTKNMKKLTGGSANPFTKGSAGVWQSSANTITLAYLPFAKNGNDIWQQTCDEILTSNTPTVSNFEFVHHAIPALCLTDAAARSLYV